jgi:hypothetical protein
VPTKKPKKTQARVPLMGVAWFSEIYGPAMTFTEDDVRHLIELSALTPSENLDLISISRELRGAVTDLIRWSATSSPDAVKLAWARKAHQDALGLLATLGADPQTGRIPLEVRLLLAPSDLDDLETNSIREAMGVFQVRGNRDATTSDDELAAIAEGRTTRHELRPGFDFVVPSAAQAVELTAYGAACTAIMAAAVIKRLGRPERRLRRGNDTEVLFIQDLCRIYETISSTKARVSLKSPAITFCCEVAKRTKALLPELPPSHHTHLGNVRNSLTRLMSPNAVLERIRSFRDGGQRAR